MITQALTPQRSNVNNWVVFPTGAAKLALVGCHVGENKNSRCILSPSNASEFEYPTKMFPRIVLVGKTALSLFSHIEKLKPAPYRHADHFKLSYAKLSWPRGVVVV